MKYPTYIPVHEGYVPDYSDGFCTMEEVIGGDYTKHYLVKDRLKPTAKTYSPVIDYLYGIPSTVMEEDIHGEYVSVDDII